MSEKIENLLGENRTFDPPSSIVENANAPKEWFDLVKNNFLIENKIILKKPLIKLQINQIDI